MGNEATLVWTDRDFLQPSFVKIPDGSGHKGSVLIDTRKSNGNWIYSGKKRVYGGGGGV